MNTGSSAPLARSQIVEKLSPHFVSICPVPENAFIQWVPARSLLCNAKRFDVILKYIYARARVQNESCAFFDAVYYETIKAMGGGRFIEGDNCKHSFDDYKKSFDTLIDSMASEGFRVDISVIPISKNGICLDGAHRLATAAALALNVPVVELDYEHCYDVQFFRDRQLPKKYLDYGILTWIEENSRIHIFNVHRRTPNRDKEIEDILQKYGTVYARKSISLNLDGYKWISWFFYRGHEWGRCFAANKDAIMWHATNCGIGKEKLRIYVVECTSLDTALAAKQEIRNLFTLGNFAIHASDTYEEAVELAQYYFNENSIHFIQNSSLMNQEWGRAIINDLRSFKDCVLLYGGKLRDILVDSSFCLALYGLRPYGDMDFITSGSFSFAGQLVECGFDNHEDHILYHQQDLLDLLHDPDNYFYSEGVKVLSLRALVRMKSNRLEGKDYQDIALINKVLKQSFLRLLSIKLHWRRYTLPKWKEVFFPAGSLRRCIAQKGKKILKRLIH